MLSKNKKYNEIAKDNWGKFLFLILLDPWTIASIIIFLGISLTTIFASQLETTQPGIVTGISLVLTFILSVFSGIVGSRFYKIYSEGKEKSALETRGNISMRGLGLILDTTYDVKTRLNSYTSKLKKNTTSNDLALHFIEELDHNFNLLLRAIYNAVENWADIVPCKELEEYKALIKSGENIKNVINDKDQEITKITTEKTIEIEKLLANKEDLESQLKQVQQDNDIEKAENKQIQEQIDKKTKEIAHLKKEIEIDIENITQVKNKLEKELAEIKEKTTNPYPYISIGSSTQYNLPLYTNSLDEDQAKNITLQLPKG